MAGYPVEYVTSPVLIVRSELTADDSFAAMRARSKFGIAMAAMIKIIATTISNSINEKPFCFRIVILFSVEANWSQQTDLPSYSALSQPSPESYYRNRAVSANILFSTGQVTS